MERPSFITDLTHLKETLSIYGVAIIPNILDEDECESMMNGAWDFLEHISSKWEVPLSQDDETTWSGFANLCALHSMLIQHHGVGQAQFLWDVRQNPKVIKVFETLWGTSDLLVSFDGASIHLPPEVTKKGHFHKMWLHTDQSYQRNDFECVQSWVTAKEVRDDDASLIVMPKSHLLHREVATAFKLNEGPKSNFERIGDNVVAFYKEKGCIPTRITCPAGSMVLWDSRTIHCGSESEKNRALPNVRCVGYICMMPKRMATKAQLKKRRKAFDEKRTMTHHPINGTLFPKSPRTYGKSMPTMTEVNTPVLIELGKKLVA